MNRFRTKKKGRDDASIGGQSSIDVEPTGPFRMFGRKKIQEDEPKREVDIASALPSSDDFRTSLLMTGLSARFSMLREQDDPNSKLGKASDDSVLFSKRQSRLADFGGLAGGLHDIAEVESLKSSQLGPFDSYRSDDASSLSGSVINRAKPTEGNNLFGGRQKIYKLNAGSRAGMSGRALYEDDVAQSSFQSWRQAEKERRSYEDAHRNDNLEAEPAPDCSHWRETSSTTYSVPSAARNSTAATSIASQPSIKDTQTAGNPPILERSVTRARRLYEQGLNQDLHDHQSSALSRMDTLSKQRPFASRTSDTASGLPSPTASTFGDRVGDRRTIISKASAPNLRSFSPTTTSSSQMSPAESTSKFLRHDQKPNFGFSPPLSPPISETEEHPGLPIQSGDRLKATVIGVFNRPAMQYDESRYAQRQRQLQQGRDAPTLKNTTEPTMSSARGRSRSSSTQRAVTERTGPQAPLPELPVRDADHGGAFLDDSDGCLAADHRPLASPTAPQLTIERPDDLDHPAFRKSALPTPLSLSSPKRTDSQASLSPLTKPDLPEDSPTLGIDSGLSGMVRQHLRNNSAASSTCGTANHEAGSYDNNISNAGKDVPSREDLSGERDEFAQHLADGARRVRQRLTTYVESDNNRSAPPTPPLPEQSKDFGSSKSAGLGILRAKSSRGSLFDRSEKERGRAKSLRSGNSPVLNSGSSPPPRKASHSRGESHNRTATADASESAVVQQQEDHVHAGLKAFRQARRELQKMKELEVQQRHGQRPGFCQEAPTNSSRAPVQENGPPPSLFNRIPRGDEPSYGGCSRAGSRAASERDRSGSEASISGYNFSRGPGLRNGSATYEENHPGPSAVNSALNGDVRRPGLESPSRPLYMANGNSQVGISPSHSVGTLESNGGRYYGSGMHYPPAQETPQRSRSRKGSLLGAAASTPNLHGSACVPPVPPINPRRKNGFGQNSEEGFGGTSPHNAYGMSDGYTREDDISGDQFRSRKHSNSQVRHSPPRIARPAIPHSNISSASLPGGMI